MDDKLNNLNKNVTSNKNELSEPLKKVKAISTKGLTKNLINKFSILFINIFLQEYFKVIYYLYQLKNTLNILEPLFRLVCGNLMEFQKKILKI